MQTTFKSTLRSLKFLKFHQKPPQEIKHKHIDHKLKKYNHNVAQNHLQNLLNRRRIISKVRKNLLKVS